MMICRVMTAKLTASTHSPTLLGTEEQSELGSAEGIKGIIYVVKRAFVCIVFSPIYTRYLNRFRMRLKLEPYNRKHINSASKQAYPVSHLAFEM